MKKSLFEKALGTTLSTRFVNLEDRLGRTPTDSEVVAEAKYQLEDLPFKGWEDFEVKQSTKEMKSLIRLAQ